MWALFAMLLVFWTAGVVCEVGLPLVHLLFLVAVLHLIFAVLRSAACG